MIWRETGRRAKRQCPTGSREWGMGKTQHLLSRLHQLFYQHILSHKSRDEKGTACVQNLTSPVKNSAHKEHQRAASAAAGSLDEPLTTDNLDCFQDLFFLKPKMGFQWDNSTCCQGSCSRSFGGMSTNNSDNKKVKQITALETGKLSTS